MNVISPGFEERSITTVRVKEMPDTVKEKFSNAFSKTNVRSLPNGATLLDVSGYESGTVGSVAEFLKENDITEFSFGKVTLNDLYSLYYQE